MHRAHSVHTFILLVIDLPVSIPHFHHATVIGLSLKFTKGIDVDVQLLKPKKIADHSIALVGI